MSEQTFEMTAADTNMYRLMRDAYYGDGGFRGPYLVPHKRETEEDYRVRQKTAYYMNYFAPIVNALVDPIFKRTPLRDWSGAASTMVDAFVEDVDGAGNDIDTFMKLAALSAKLYGAVFIVVENYQAMDLPDNLADAVAQRKFPYAYTLDPDKVESYSIDKNGRVLAIKFRDTTVTSTMGKTVERTVYYDTKVWSIDENGHTVASGEHGLGVVPVIFFPSQQIKNGELNPVPELYSVAGIAAALYNHCSWETEIIRNQTFPVLTFPSKDAKDLVIGSNNALCYDGDNIKNPPGYISPPSDPAEMIQSQIKLLIQEMYRQAGLSFINGQAAQQTSGIARQWEFERTNQRLATFAKRCAQTEKKMMQMFALWLGQELKYDVTYSSDFGITDVATELANAQAVLDMGLTPELKVEVAKNVLTSYVPELDTNRFDEIIKAVEKAVKEPEYNEPPVPPASFQQQEPQQQEPEPPAKE